LCGLIGVQDHDDLGMKGKVLYIWFDALDTQASQPTIPPNGNNGGSIPTTFVSTNSWGKDNVYFHTIYFPSVELGDGRDWTTLHHLSTTEYLNYEGGKFSKSKNRGVFGPSAREIGIPASVWRYYLLLTRPETADAMFLWADCIVVNNNVLLNNFGNFVNRALKFVSSQYDSVIPDGGDAPGPISPNDKADSDFISDLNALIKDYTDAMEAVKLRLGLQTVMLISNRGNLYLQSSGLNKALMTENPTRCAQVMSRAVNLIYVLSSLIYPFMPATSDSILTQLNAPARVVPDVLSTDILAGHHIGKPEHLFKKIEEKMGDVWREKFRGADPDAEAPGADGSKAAAAATTTSKRKAVAAAKKVVAKLDSIADGTPKSPEVLALEAEVAEQGSLVRSLKAKTPKTQEVDRQIASAVGELVKLKGELLALIQK